MWQAQLQPCLRGHPAHCKLQHTHTNETRRGVGRLAALSVTLTTSGLAVVPAPLSTQAAVEAVQDAATLSQLVPAAAVGSTVSMRSCSCGSDSPARQANVAAAVVLLVAAGQAGSCNLWLPSAQCSVILPENPWLLRTRVEVVGGQGDEQLDGGGSVVVSNNGGCPAADGANAGLAGEACVASGGACPISPSVQHCDARLQAVKCDIAAADSGMCPRATRVTAPSQAHP